MMVQKIVNAAKAFLNNNPATSEINDTEAEKLKE